MPFLFFTCLELLVPSFLVQTGPKLLIVELEVTDLSSSLEESTAVKEPNTVRVFCTGKSRRIVLQAGLFHTQISVLFAQIFYPRLIYRPVHLFFRFISSPLNEKTNRKECVQFSGLSEKCIINKREKPLFQFRFIYQSDIF